MSPKITATHEHTKRSKFLAQPFRGELLLEPKTRPQVTIERSSHGPGIRPLIKDVLDLSEIEVLIDLLGAIAEELRPKDEVTEGASE